jgi:hypothetical protein
MLQASMSTFDPALGKQPTAHRSGRALEALQGQSVEANSHYLANFADISLMYEAKVWLDLAPRVYDRPERIVRILQGDKSQLAMLGMPFTRDGQGMPHATPQDQPVPPDALHFDFSKGRYGITTTIGKSKSSRLQSGNDALTAIIQAEPATLPIIGPLWAMTLDFPYHNELAELLQKDRDHRMPWLAPANGQQDPASLAAENQALKAQLSQAAQMIQSKIAEKQVEQQGKMAITQVQETAETIRDQAANETKIAVAELGAKVDRLALFLEERARLGVQGHEAGMQATDQAHEVAMAAMDHGSATDQAAQAHAQTMQQAEQSNAHTQDQAQQQADLAPPPSEATS